MGFTVLNWFNSTIEPLVRSSFLCFLCISLLFSAPKSILPSIPSHFVLDLQCSLSVIIICTFNNWNLRKIWELIPAKHWSVFIFMSESQTRMREHVIALVNTYPLKTALPESLLLYWPGPRGEKTLPGAGVGLHAYERSSTFLNLEKHTHAHTHTRNCDLHSAVSPDGNHYNLRLYSPRLTAMERKTWKGPW